MKHKSNNLKEELKAAGASAAEIKDLLPIATGLGQLKSSVSRSTARRYDGTRLRKLLPLGISLITGLALGVALVISSQTVLPGSWLYPVQKFSDNVAISADPSYRGTVMMKRAQEVKQLIVQQASPQLVLATLADYRSEALAYKLAPESYAAFEYCKVNLRQAATMASSSERQAINYSLASLSSV